MLFTAQCELWISALIQLAPPGDWWVCSCVVNKMAKKAKKQRYGRETRGGGNGLMFFYIIFPSPRCKTVVVPTLFHVHSHQFTWIHSHEWIHILTFRSILYQTPCWPQTKPITTHGYISLPPAASFPAVNDDVDRHANIAVSPTADTLEWKYKGVSRTTSLTAYRMEERTGHSESACSSLLLFIPLAEV